MLSAYLRLVSSAFLTFILLSANNSVAGINDGLIAYYSFDNSLNDISGNSNNGSPVGNVTYTNGVLGQAISLNGSAFVEIANGPLVTGKDISVSALVKLDNTFSQIEANTIFTLGDYDNAHVVHQIAVLGGGRPAADIGKIQYDNWPNSGGWTVTPTTVQAEQWTHIAYTRSADNVSIYIDGELSTTGVGEELLALSDIDVTVIGGRPSSVNFIGAIDEVRIYNRALSASEIGELYSQPTQTSESNLLAYYSFDNQAATDFSGNGYNGVPANGVSFSTLGFDGAGFSATLDGVDDFIQTFVPSNVDTFSYSFWVYPLSLNQSMSILGSDGYPSLPYHGKTLLVEADGDLFIHDCPGMQVGAGCNDIYFTSGILASEWSHIAVSVDNGVGNFYINGSAAGSTSEITAFGVPWIIGNYGQPDNNVSNFHGRIDELKFYNKALSTSEIFKDYQESGNYVSDPQDKPGKAVDIHVLSTNGSTVQNTFNPNYPTVVITHGWQNTGNYADNNDLLDTGTMLPLQIIANAIDSRLFSETYGGLGGVNIIQPHWEGAYNSSNGAAELSLVTYGNPLAYSVFEVGARRSREQADEAGKAIADALIALGINATYSDSVSKPIHLIGHSHGSLANIFVTERLVEQGVYIEQFTILDAPTNSPADIGEFSKSLFLKKLGASNVPLVDNWFGRDLTGFGEGIFGAFPGNGGQALDFFLAVEHTQVWKEFYPALIANDTAPPGTSSNNPLDVAGWITPLMGTHPLTNYGMYLATDGYQPAVNVLNEFNLQVIDDYVATTPSGVVGYDEGTAVNLDSNIQIAFDVQDRINNNEPVSIISIVKSSPASLNLSLSVPADALLFKFESLITIAGSGDWASIYINGELAWTNELSTSNTSETESNFISIDKFSGQNVILQISLNDVGAGSAEFYVGNFAFLSATDDQDSDKMADFFEYSSCTDILDADSDDDGLLDGDEDLNDNGVVDQGETDPCNLDSDGDGIQDGTESGIALPIPDDPANSVLGTDTNVFIPDGDVLTTTDPTLMDTDGDTLSDGVEDANFNGAVDEGESDPADDASITPGLTVPALPFVAYLLLGITLLGIRYKFRK